MEHHFGSDRVRLKYKTGGLSNFVFEVKNSDGEFIVRISPDKSHLDAFIKEHWCERAARRAGVPTAEILEPGRLDHTVSLCDLAQRRGHKRDGSSGAGQDRA